MPDPTLTLADRLNALAASHAGGWDRARADDGTVTVRLHFAGGMLAASGASDAEAVTTLETRAAAYAAALGNS